MPLYMPQMSRALKPEETSIYKTFSTKLRLEEMTDLKGMSMQMGTTRYSVQDPVAYKIKGTDSTLVFGNLRNSIDIEQLRRIYEATFKDEKEEVRGLYSKIEETPKDEMASTNSQERISSEREETIRPPAEADCDAVDSMEEPTK